MLETPLMDSLAYAFGPPSVMGCLRQQPEDFEVEEVLGFTPEGEGEHVFLLIEKRNTNTDWLARRLARFAEVKPMAVGFSGLKDRHAVTRQWFSVHLPGQAEPDWQILASDEIRILANTRHARKLKRGVHKANRFRLRVTGLQGDLEQLPSRLQQAAAEGVPNYFGAQRFGREGGNLVQARRLFAGELKKCPRPKRSLYLSAARAWLFNLVLSERVRRHDWNRPLAGDLYTFSAGRSLFGPEAVSDTLRRRVAAGEIHPTGPLWGEGATPASDEAAKLERHVVAAEPQMAAGLEQAGLAQERRALRLLPDAMHWQLHPDCLELAFSLPSGAFATSVLRELIKTDTDNDNGAPGRARNKELP